MKGQLHFEIVEEEILLEGFVFTKGNTTEVIEDVLIYEDFENKDPKKRKFIKLEKGGIRFESNIFGDPKYWPQKELQEYVNLLLESSRWASDEDKKNEIFFLAKSYVAKKPKYSEKFNGRGCWREYSEEEDKYIKATLLEAERFFQTGECSFASQSF